MLGSCAVKQKSSMDLDVWSAGPWPVGCLKHEGKYYYNLVSGNTARPDVGLGVSYAVGSDNPCELIHYIASMGMQSPQTAGLLNFFSTIGDYENGKPYKCGDFVIYKGRLHEAIADGTRHPDDGTAWTDRGNVNQFLKAVFHEPSGHVRMIPIWRPCGAGCATDYGVDACVVLRVETGADECGKATYTNEIYTSLVAKNTERPSPESDVWDGPYTECEYANRPVGQTLNGKPVKPASGVELLSTEDLCDAFEIVDIEACEDCEPTTEKRVCPKPIGTEQNGESVVVGGEHDLVTADAFADVFDLQEVEIDECLPDCNKKTVQRFALKGEIGKTCGGEPVNVGDSLAVCADIDVINEELAAINGEIDTIKAEIPTLTTQQMAYFFGVDKGSEVTDDHTAIYDIKHIVGPFTESNGEITVGQSGLYAIDFTASAEAVEGGGDGLTILTLHVNGNSNGDETNISGIAWSLSNNDTPNFDGDDYHKGIGLTRLNAGDKLVLKTADGYGYKNHKKGGINLRITQLPESITNEDNQL